MKLLVLLRLSLHILFIVQEFFVRICIFNKRGQQAYHTAVLILNIHSIFQNIVCTNKHYISYILLYSVRPSFLSLKPYIFFNFRDPNSLS